MTELRTGRDPFYIPQVFTYYRFRRINDYRALKLDDLMLADTNTYLSKLKRIHQNFFFTLKTPTTKLLLY